MTTPAFTCHTDADSGLTELTLSRPERFNALDPALFRALRQTVQALDAAGHTRVLLISSTGKHFSAGMALEVFASDLALLSTDTARQRQAFQAGLRALMDDLDVLDTARFPVICAVQGGCIGGALDLAAACDIRVCTADAFFTIQEIVIGMAADMGSLQRLPKILPQGLVRQMAYTGERLDAQRALAHGLVNAVLPDAAALREHALALAREIASRSPLAIATSKQALNYARDHGVADSLAQMRLLQSAAFDIGEMGRAIEAWRDKRAADFAPLAPTPSATD
jgi:enoyl-CoA hydratase